MTGIAIYDVSIATFQRGMVTMKNILAKAQESADAASLPSASLYADMRDLTFQIQSCSTTIRKAVWRLTDAETEEWADTEETLDQLIARCDKTLALLATVDPKTLEGKETALVDITLSGNPKKIPGQDYVLTFALPNFFFHLQTAYAILRMHGVALGKPDFLVPFLTVKAH